MSELNSVAKIQSEGYVDKKLTFYAADVRVWTGDGRLFVDMTDCDNPPVICVDISDSGDLQITMGNGLNQNDITYIIHPDGKWRLKE